MKKSKNAFVKDQIVSVPFSYIKTTTLASSTASETLFPAFFPRVLNEADAFDLYRFTKLKFRVLDDTSSTPDQVIVGFYPGVTDTAPASISDVSECNWYSFRGKTWTQPGGWSVVPPAVLRGQLPWFKTIQGAATNVEEIQGKFFFFGGAQAANTIRVEYRGICELKGASNTGSTPAARARLERQRERERLISILQEEDEDDVSDKDEELTSNGEENTKSKGASPAAMSVAEVPSPTKPPLHKKYTAEQLKCKALLRVKADKTG